MKSVLKKELSILFKTSMFYVVLSLFMLASGWIFFNFLVSFVENTQNLPAAYRSPLDLYTQVIFKFFGNINILFLFLVPIFTMKSFAKEYEEQSIEVYFSAPISDWALVIGKYLSCFIPVFIILMSTFVSCLVFYFIGVEDFTFILTSLLALGLNLIFYTAIGVFASSMTNNQLMAGVMGFVGILFFWMISWGLNISNDYFLIENLKYIAVINHFEQILHGIFNLSDFFYYFSFTFIFLFLTKKKIESRKWELF